MEEGDGDQSVDFEVPAERRQGRGQEWCKHCCAGIEDYGVDVGDPVVRDEGEDEVVGAVVGVAGQGLDDEFAARSYRESFQVYD